jgi:hypothetical protein
MLYFRILLHLVLEFNLGFIYVHTVNTKKTDHSSVEGTTVPSNLKTPDDGRVGRKMQCNDGFYKKTEF